MLEIESLTTRYGSIAALRDATLRVGEGEIVGVIGPNGAGKTTLLNSVAGLLSPTGRAGAARRHRYDRCPARQDAARRRGPRARAPPPLRRPDGAREPPGGRYHRHGPPACRAARGDGRAVPCAGRTTRHAGRLPVRRRGPTTGHRPRPHERTPDAADGRAVPGPGPRPRGPGLRPHRPAGGRRAHPPGGGAERPPDAERLRPGLHHAVGGNRRRGLRPGTAGAQGPSSTPTWGPRAEERLAAAQIPIPPLDSRGDSEVRSQVVRDCPEEYSPLASGIG